MDPSAFISSAGRGAVPAAVSDAAISAAVFAALANKKRKGRPSSTDADVRSSPKVVVSPNSKSVDLNDPWSLLGRLTQLLKESVPEPPPSLSARRQRIVQLGDEIEELYNLEEAIAEYVSKLKSTIEEKKEKELSALYDSFSPLLSLGKPCLSNILGYLDEEALFSAEQASGTLTHIAQEGEHWSRLSKNLKEKYYKDCGSPPKPENYLKSPISPVIQYPFMQIGATFLVDYAPYTFPEHDRVLPSHKKQHPDAPFLHYFGSVAKCARELEVLGEKYYDYSSNRGNAEEGNELDFQVKLDNEEISSLRGIYSRREPIRYRHITDRLQRDHDSNTIWFLRISRVRNTDAGGSVSHSLLWQGTLKHGWLRYPNNCFHGMSSDLTFLLGEDTAREWPELKQFAEWHKNVTANNPRSVERLAEAERRARQTFGGIRISIIMNHRQLLSTGGFERTERILGKQQIWLQSRYEKEDGQQRHGLCVETLFSMRGSNVFLNIRASPSNDDCDNMENLWRSGSYHDFESHDDSPALFDDDYISYSPQGTGYVYGASSDDDDDDDDGRRGVDQGASSDDDDDGDY